MSTDFERTHEILAEAFIGLSFEKIKRLALGLDGFLSPSMVLDWLNRPNTNYDNKSPVEISIEFGDDGLDRLITCIYKVGAVRNAR